MVVDTEEGGLKPARGRNKTSGESFVLFVICFVEMDFVGVLWKQTRMVNNSEKAEQSIENEIS